MNNLIRFSKTCLLPGLALLMTGCATERYHFTEDAREERKAAVEKIMAQQILDPGATERNSERLLDSEDGQRAINTLQGYRKGRPISKIKNDSNSIVTLPDPNEIFK